jgi:hypothetical protein
MRSGAASTTTTTRCSKIDKEIIFIDFVKEDKWVDRLVNR